ncbi:MAG: hypothetical protein PHN57_00265 [Candidatus Omnitrophica bacterium]|nr:hypothetical protein [Candidatus Omnitrophota bacterium]
MLDIFSVALLNTKQGVREKTFWVIAFFFAFLLAAALFLGELSIGEKEAALRDISLSSIEISCLVLIVFGLVINFYREKETRLKELYLSYFSQASYLTGKLLGYIFICFMYVLVTTLLAGVLLFFNHAFNWQIIAASYSIFLKLSIFSAVSLLFSALFDYALLASLATFFFYIASEFAYSAVKIVSVTKNEAARFFIQFIYYALPNVEKVDLKYQAIYGQPVSFFHLSKVSAYVIIYILFCLSLAVLAFRSKEH